MKIKMGGKDGVSAYDNYSSNRYVVVRLGLTEGRGKPAIKRQALAPSCPLLLQPGVCRLARLLYVFKASSRKNFFGVTFRKSRTPNAICSLRTTRKEENVATPRAKGRTVEVEVLTETYRVKGSLFIPLAGEGGYGSRLSDFLNNTDRHFLALTNVTVEVLPEPEMTWQAPFLAVNKSVVTMVRALKE